MPKDIQDRPVENVGELLLQTEESRSWCGSSGRGESDEEFCFAIEIREPAIRTSFQEWKEASPGKS